MTVETESKTASAAVICCQCGGKRALFGQEGEAMQTGMERIAEGLEPMEAWAELPEISHPEQAQEAMEFQRYDEANELVSEGYRISEGRYTETGLYVPGRVEQIEPEAVEFDPEMKELSCELETWVERKETMSCAVASQTMAINQLERGSHTEQELLDIGREHGWYNDGTLPKDVGKIAEWMGAEVERRRGVDASELKLANDSSLKVLANVDSSLLYQPESGKRCQPDHCVQVLRVESTQQGEFVILNDPGHANGRGVVYPMEIFEKAYRGDITTIRKGVPA